VAATTAIGLARLGRRDYRARLAEIVRTLSLPLPLRRAAAETLSRVGDPSPRALIDELIDQYGRFGGEGKASYAPLLHAELLRGLARHVSPFEDERFVAALASPDPVVRATSLDVWAWSSGDALPAEVARSIDDPDPRVRIAAIRSVSSHESPVTLGALRHALDDQDLGVKLTAIQALGRLEGERARKMLAQVLADQTERLREAAALALGNLGDRTSVYAAIEDKSWRVRRAVAAALASDPSPQGAAVAKRLLADRSSEVRLRAVQAVAQWPLETAGPLLLDAAATNDQRASAEAISTLAKRWPPAADLPARAFAAGRSDALVALRRRWQGEFGKQGDSSANSAAGHRAAAKDSVKVSAPAVSDERFEQIETMLLRYSRANTPTGRRQAEAELVGLDAELIAAANRLVIQEGRPLDEGVYRDVLVKISPVFAAIERIHDGELSSRREAAGSMVRIVAGQPLPPLAVHRLAVVAIAQSDPIIWQCVLTAVASDGSEPAQRLAYAALTHPIADVRRRGCEYLQNHGRPQHAKMLLPLLDDPDDSVVLATVRALEQVQTLDDATSLEQLLASPDKSLRVAAATTLARLGHASGPAALERYCFDTDEAVRRQTAGAMGSLGNPLYTATLVRLLDDKSAVRREALIALPKVVGEDVVGETDPTITPAEKAMRWKRKYRVGS